MTKGSYFRKDERRFLELAINDLQEQFEKSGFDEIPYTFNHKIFGEKTKIEGRRRIFIIRRFLKAEGKIPRYRGSSPHGVRYGVTITIEEFKKWKEDVENLKNTGYL